MNIKTTKSVEVTDKTARGADVSVRGSTGMVTLKVKNMEMILYTDEIPTLVNCLNAVAETLKSKQEL